MTVEAMGPLLTQLNAFPGVVGSMVCTDRGEVLADAFPAQIDRGAPAKAAQLLADHAAGLAAIGGPVSALSIRFGQARLLARPVGTGHLLIVCAPSVNPQSLSMLAAATAPKLERLMEPAAAPPPLPAPARAAPVEESLFEDIPPEAPAPPPRPAPSPLYLMVQRIEATIVRKKLDPFRTRGAISMAAGFGLRAIDEDTPDDPQMRSKLEAAAQAVLGEKP
jgi:predicted regulator of Ras-like GTPase activity (Roadblock/LC7/MglB family)